MDYRSFGNKYIVRLDKGDEILKSLGDLATKEDIKLGRVSGIGAVNRATIGLFETATKEYHSKELIGDMEIVNLAGNISQMDGEVYLHLHIALGDREFNLYGGHLNSATISVTGEIVVDVIDGSVDRKLDEEIGLNLLKFDK